MEQRISLVTLAVADLEATRRFYVDGLGWEPLVDVAGEVLMFRAGERLVLSLWDRAHFAEEVGEPMAGTGVPPLTIAHNLGSKAEVDAVLEEARAAGARPVHDAVDREWGGYSGYFADPDGYRWEIAWAPGMLSDVVLPRPQE